MRKKNLITTQFTPLGVAIILIIAIVIIGIFAGTGILIYSAFVR